MIVAKKKRHFYRSLSRCIADVHSSRVDVSPSEKGIGGSLPLPTDHPPLLHCVCQARDLRGNVLRRTFFFFLVLEAVRTDSASCVIDLDDMTP